MNQKESDKIWEATWHLDRETQTPGVQAAKVALKEAIHYDDPELAQG